MAQLGFIPRGGESFEYGGHRFSVVEMDGRRVARVKIQLPPQLPAPTAAADQADAASPDTAAKQKSVGKDR
jgi:putative hemolysin